MHHILIFKTNIEQDFELNHVNDVFKNIESIINWNVDREDRDKVLRVESLKNNISEIISVLKNIGFFCEELQG